MSGESVSSGCVRCGRPVVTDDVRVGVSFAPADIARLARDTTDPKMRDRLLCALGTVDRDLEAHTRAELLNDTPGCKTCETLADEITSLERKLRDAHSDNEELAGIMTDMENTWRPIEY